MASVCVAWLGAVSDVLNSCIGVAMNSVQNLLKRPFSLRPLEEKLEIKNLGRPKPELPELQQVTKNNNRTVVRKFNFRTYENNDWLCGCSVKNAVFCFPCLLFGGDHYWTKKGMTDLNHMSERIKKHGSSSLHINNMLNLALLGQRNIRAQLNLGYRQTVKFHNDRVTENREEFVQVKEENPNLCSENYEDPEPENLVADSEIGGHDGESNLSLPAAINESGPSTSQTNLQPGPETSSFQRTVSPSFSHEPLSEPSHHMKSDGLGADSLEPEDTFVHLEAIKLEHKRRLEIMEKEHEMKMEILRIEKETAELNRELARRQLRSYQ